MSITARTIPASWFRAFCLLILISLSLSACSPATVVAPAAATSAPTETETPLPTATETATPAPTATQTPTATPTKTATPDKKATAQAKSTATAEAILAQIQPDLDVYGISADSGHVEWSNDETIALPVDSYGQSIYFPLNIEPVADFLFQTDILWDSTSGLAGCGLIFRSEEDFQRGQQYNFLIMRLQYMPVWAIEYHRYGQYQYSVTSNGRAQTTGDLNDERRSSNKIAILAEGTKLTTFINGEKVETWEDNKMLEGLMALLSWQESGESTCEFSNSWLWVLDKK